MLKLKDKKLRFIYIKLYKLFFRVTLLEPQYIFHNNSAQ